REGVAVQESNAATALGYLDVAPGGRLIERIEIGGAVHEAHRGQCGGEIEQARVVPWIRSPARIHVLSPFGSNGSDYLGHGRSVSLSRLKVLGANLNRSESCLSSGAAPSPPPPPHRAPRDAIARRRRA